MVWDGKEITGIDMVATGKHFTKILNESGFTDRELSAIMGLSVQSINKWRHGHNLPDIENLFILSRLLGMKVDDLLVPQAEIDNDVGVEDDSTSFSLRMKTYYKLLASRCLKYVSFSTVS